MSKGRSRPWCVCAFVMMLASSGSYAQDTDDPISPDPIDPVPGTKPLVESPDGSTLSDSAELSEEGVTANQDGLLDVVDEDDPMLGDENLWPGEPDAFEDLELDEEEGEATGAASDLAGVGEERFDAGVLRGELLPGGFGAPLEREGLRLGVGLQGSYDSNIFADESDEVDDFIFTISPSIEFRSAPPGVPGQVTVQYTPFIRLYLEDSDLNTIDHSGNATVSFTGTRGSVAVSGNYGNFSRTDRFVGGLVETQSFGGSASASYQVGSRTFLEASASASFTEDSGRERSTATLPGTSSDDTWRAQVSALWQATTRLRVGPSGRYSHSSSSTFDDRNAFALLGVVDFQVRDDLSLGGSIGLEKVESGQFGDETDVTGSLSASYQPNDRFAFQGDLSYEAIPEGRGQVARSSGGTRSLNGGLSASYTPNPDWTFGVRVTAESFPSADLANTSIGDQTYGASVTRHLQNGSIALDGSVGFSEFDPVGPVAVQRNDDEYYSVALRYQRSVFQEQGSLTASVQWSENSGDRDWQRLQVALGLSLQF